MPNLEEVYLHLGVRFSLLISYKKKQQQKEAASSSFFLFLRWSGKLFQLLLSVRSHTCPSPVPGRKHCFSPRSCCTPPTHCAKAGGSSVLAAIWMLGPMDAFSNQPFSPFGVPQSLLEEGDWGLQSC